MTDSQDGERKSASAGLYAAPSSQAPPFESAVNSGRIASMNLENQEKTAAVKEARAAVSDGADFWGSYESDKAAKADKPNKRDKADKDKGERT
jgi:hypothetical protein